MSMLGVRTDFDLVLRSDSTLEGSQALMGFAAQLQGQWAFNANNNTLTLKIVAMMMGMPAAQDLMQMQITGRTRLA